MNMKRRIFAAFLSVFMLILTACGGGGGTDPIIPDGYVKYTSGRVTAWVPAGWSDFREALGLGSGDDGAVFLTGSDGTFCAIMDGGESSGEWDEDVLDKDYWKESLMAEGSYESVDVKAIEKISIGKSSAIEITVTAKQNGTYFYLHMLDIMTGKNESVVSITFPDKDNTEIWNNVKNSISIS